jgi:predicted amidophosphoribosyltransferase
MGFCSNTYGSKQPPCGKPCVGDAKLCPGCQARSRESKRVCREALKLNLSQRGRHSFPPGAPLQDHYMKVYRALCTPSVRAPQADALLCPCHWH